MIQAFRGFRGDDFDGNLRDARQEPFGAEIWAGFDHDGDIGAHEFVFGELVGRLGKDKVTGGQASELGESLEEKFVDGDSACCGSHNFRLAQRRGVLRHLFDVDERRVVPGVTGVAIVVVVIANGFIKLAYGEVTKRIGFDELTDFLVS